MIQKIAAYSLSSLLCATVLSAGVVFEIEIEDHNESPPKRSSVHISADDANVRMDMASADRTTNETTMVFRSAQSQMVVLDHAKKSYFIVDQKMVDSIASAINPMIEQALKNVPEAQRAEVEKMMKERMGSIPGQPAPEPKSDYRETGETQTINGYPAERYDVYEAGKKKREIWISKWKHIEGSGEILAGFESMAEFGRKIIDSMSQMGGGQGGIGSQFDFLTRIKEFGGFPVMSRELRADGSEESITRLVKSTPRDLAGNVFDTPEGYTQQQMFGGM